MSNSFVFYESFLDAIELLPANEQAEAYRAIALYALKGEEAEITSSGAKMVFIMAKPQLDANSQRRTNGKSGGRPKKESKGLVEEKPEEDLKEIEDTEDRSDSFENKKPKDMKMKNLM